MFRPTILSRFTVIEINDYTPEEKAEIFRRYSLPRVLQKLSMKPEECVVEDSAVERIVEKYADCAGCRELEQEAEHLASHALYEIELTGVPSVVYTADSLNP